MNAGAEIRINGTALSSDMMANLVDVRVEDNLFLPDAFCIRLGDPSMATIDNDPLPLGADVEVLLGDPASPSLVSVLKGQIAAVEPEFGTHGVIIAARGYDQSHALNRTHLTQTYQNMTADDIARKVVARSGLQAGTIDSSGEVYDFVQQSNETDWQFLWRLAQRIDFEVVVSDRTLHFRHAGASGGSPIALQWGDNLLGFRPRVTGVQQVNEVVVRGWDPGSKDVIESRAKADKLGVQIGVQRDDVVSAAGGGTLTVADRPVMTSGEADGLASSLAARLANAYVEAEGACRGDPNLVAGATVQVNGVGTRFGGTYTLSSTTHVFRGRQGYETRFTIGGRSPRSLVDLMTPAAPRGWGKSLVIGVVSQNDDPDSLGRVRVSVPELGDGTESWWAPVAMPAAGSNRGMLVLPQPGDEVVVGFEHGEPRRPYVLGSVWNGKDKPGDDLVHTDGSLAMRNDKQVWVSAGDVITVKGEKDMTVETDGKIGHKAKDDLSVEGQQVSVKANSSMTLEASGDLTIKAQSLTIQASGQVQVKGSSISLG
ncbi:MAG: VgrG-related protein [Gaiellales bacterium]